MSGAPAAQLVRESLDAAKEIGRREAEREAAKKYGPALVQAVAVGEQLLNVVRALRAQQGAAAPRSDNGPSRAAIENVVRDAIGRVLTRSGLVLVRAARSQAAPAKLKEAAAALRAEPDAVAERMVAVALGLLHADPDARARALVRELRGELAQAIETFLAEPASAGARVVSLADTELQRAWAPKYCALANGGSPS